MKRQPSTQQITWFLDLDRNGQLDLNPPYQRKSVWSPKDRRFFLDTIFRNYPTPPIFIHRSLSDQGVAKYHVVDGKQRLETILSFAKNKIALDPTFGDINLNSKKFNDLLMEDKRKFWDYTLVVDFIETIDGANIEEVFDRVNRNSRNLQPQELRHARYNGWFITEAENESEDDFWWDVRVNSSAKEKRMRNVQFISELLFVLIENKIVGFSQDHIDEMYATFDDVTVEVDEEAFDEDEFLAKKRFIKSYLRAMEAENNSISQYGKTANNLYVLWSLIALETELPEADVIARRYETFMNQLAVLSATEDADALVSSDASFTNHYQYFKNSKGASTDLPQRDARYQSLKLALLGQNENT
ncbi:DUF262 domain-containing protein [Pedobacter miscanthi]|uniref:DUF262 domain-containing protein n=1 Tax=Pedobacter miscanthi TaxID=2259170 RepID=UPI00292E1A62|nr:DUF262 domain-containing protein [Pedobacter miscanthi]